MTNRHLSLVLATLMVSLVVVTSASAKPNAEREAQLAAKVRTAVAKLGTGSSARIEIKLNDGTRLKGSRPAKDAQLADRVKAAVAKLGTGSSARIEIKLIDGTSLKGYVSETAEDHFVIVDDKTGAETAVPYPQVKQVKGNNLSTGAKIVIGVAVVVGVLALVGWLARGS